MAIRLPSFPDPRIVSLVICGEVQASKKNLKAIGAKSARYRGQFGTQYTRLFGKAPSESHLHLDIDAAEILWKPRKPTHTKKDIEESLRSVSGTVLDAAISATFIVSMDDLPERGIIRAMQFRTSVGLASLTMDGGSVRVAGAPIHQMSWSIRSDEKSAYVKLESAGIVVVEGDYISDQLSMLLNTFKSLVLGDTSNAKAEA